MSDEQTDGQSEYNRDRDTQPKNEKSQSNSSLCVIHLFLLAFISFVKCNGVYQIILIIDWVDWAIGQSAVAAAICWIVYTHIYECHNHTLYSGCNGILFYPVLFSFFFCCCCLTINELPTNETLPMKERMNWVCVIATGHPRNRTNWTHTQTHNTRTHTLNHFIWMTKTCMRKCKITVESHKIRWQILFCISCFFFRSFSMQSNNTHI